MSRENVRQHLMLLPGIIIVIGLVYTIFNAVTFISYGNRLFGVDLASYIATSKALTDSSFRSSTFLYSFPLIPIVILPIVLLIDSMLVLYKVLILFGIILLFILWIVYLYLIKKIVDDPRNYPLITLPIMLVVFYRPLLEQYAWGGHAQILSDILGILSLTLVMDWDHGKKEGISRKFILSIILITLSLSAEPYSGIFWLLSIIFYMSFRAYRNTDRKKMFLSLLIYSVSSILFFIVAYLLFDLYVGIGLSTSNTPYIPNILYLPQLMSYLINFLVSSGSILSPKWLLIVFIFLLLVVISIIKILAPLKFSLVNGISRLLSLSMWTSFVILFLVTPSYYADRFTHFLVFPLSLELLNILMQLRDTRLSFRILKTIIVVSTIVVSVISGYFFNEYLYFYSFDSDQVILADEMGLDGGIVSLGIHPFIASMVAKDGLYPIFQPVWFTRPGQIKAAVLGSLFLSNYYILNFSDTFITLSYDGSRISVYRYLAPYFLNTLDIRPATIILASNNSYSVLLESDISNFDYSIGDTSFNFVYYNGELNGEKKTIYIKNVSFNNDYIKIIYNFSGFPVERVFISLPSSKFIVDYIVASRSANYLEIYEFLLYKEPWFVVRESYKVTLEVSNGVLGSKVSTEMNYIEILTRSAPLMVEIKIFVEKMKVNAPIYEHLLTKDILINMFNIEYLIFSNDYISEIPEHINVKVVYRNRSVTVYIIV